MDECINMKMLLCKTVYVKYIANVVALNFFFLLAFCTDKENRESNLSGKIEIMPESSEDILLNPGKGWVLYGVPSNHTSETISMGTTGYRRYNWMSIEPEEGKYNWQLIDNDIEAWASVGKKYAFGIMNANSAAKDLIYVTPKWVFDAGAQYVDCSITFNNWNFIQRTPVWDDPVFLQKVNDLVNALALRYDNNPNVTFIDMRSYGNYGESHVFRLEGSTRLTPEKLQEHINIYKNAFKNTRIIIPTSWYDEYLGVYESATNNECGLRIDGVFNSPTGRVSLAYGKTPAVFEFSASYQSLKSSHNWDANKLRNDVNVGRPSYIGMGAWGNDGDIMVSEERTLVNELANKMGYHFVLKKVTIPRNIAVQSNSEISFEWENQGVANLYESCFVALSILDQSDNVIRKYWIDQSNPSKWEPGKTTENISILFDNIEDGKYKFAIGLFQKKDSQRPDYKIDNENRTSNGWYVITDNVKKKGDKYVISR